MILVLIAALALLLLIVAGLVSDAGTSRTDDRASELRDELSITDQQIQSEYRAARRAMNNAAGQSWRNLIDGDG